MNNNIGHYFQTKKGVRQGDPLSPILFNIVVDILAILIDRAKGTGLIRGLVPNLVEISKMRGIHPFWLCRELAVPHFNSTEMRRGAPGIQSSDFA